MPNAFKPKKHEPNLNKIKYDEYYIERWFKDKVVKTGEGEDDFTIVKVVVEDKKSIKELIEAQADDVGLENILKKFALTGDETILPENVNAGNEVIDFTQMPQDLIDANNIFNAQEKAYAGLPDEIKKGRSFADFMTSFTQNEFDAYSNALKERLQSKKAKEEKGE